MKKGIVLVVIIFFTIFGLINAQNVEIDFGIGIHVSKINFHHSSAVSTEDDVDFQTYDNSNFRIGITSPLGKGNWYLKTGIGFLKTNSFFIISYKYDEGFGEKNAIVITYLTNQKLYLSVAPEYRINLKPIFIKFNGGLLVTSDIANTLSSSNTVLLPKSNTVGLKFGTGIQYLRNRIGVEVKVSYAKIGQSELQNRWHPKISYDFIFFNFGVVYAL